MFAFKTLQKILLLLMVHLICSRNISYAQDTLSTATPDKAPGKIFKAEPFRATMLAVAFPGLGQIYNRKFWKVPFVYAGFGGLAFFVSFNGSNYNKFMKAYQDFIDLVPETDSYIPIVRYAEPSVYDPVRHPDTYEPSEASWVRDGLLRQVDYFKKYRDLSYIGFAVWYLVTILDANVDASLFNYDISDNLDLDVAPVQMSMSGQAGIGVNMCLRVTF